MLRPVDKSKLVQSNAAGDADAAAAAADAAAREAARRGKKATAARAHERLLPHEVMACNRHITATRGCSRTR